MPEPKLSEVLERLREQENDEILALSAMLITDCKLARAELDKAIADKTVLRAENERLADDNQRLQTFIRERVANKVCDTYMEGGLQFCRDVRPKPQWCGKCAGTALLADLKSGHRTRD